MAVHDANLLRRFRIECLSKAERNLQDYTRKNKYILTDLITTAVNDLKSGDTEAIMDSSYKLYSAATSFSRPDISNLADLLRRMMRNPELAGSKEVLKSFEAALIELSALPRPSGIQEKKVLDGLHKILRKHNS